MDNIFVKKGNNSFKGFLVTDFRGQYYLGDILYKSLEDKETLTEFFKEEYNNLNWDEIFEWDCKQPKFEPMKTYVIDFYLEHSNVNWEYPTECETIVHITKIDDVDYRPAKSFDTVEITQELFDELCQGRFK